MTAQIHTRSNVHFARANQTVKFVAKNNKVVVSVVDSDVHPVKSFPPIVVKRDGDIFTVHVNGQKPPVQVWAKTPAQAFARGVRAFWTVRSVRRAK